MFCALNGATGTPRRRSHAQIAVAIQLLPAFDDVPPMKMGRARIIGLRSWRLGTQVHRSRAGLQPRQQRDAAAAARHVRCRTIHTR